MERTVYIFNHRCVHELEYVFQRFWSVDEPCDPTLVEGVTALLAIAFESIRGNHSFPTTPNSDLPELYDIWDEVKILMDNLLYDLRSHLSQLPGAAMLVDGICVKNGAIYLYIGNKQWQQQKNYSNEALRLISIPTHL